MEIIELKRLCKYLYNFIYKEEYEKLKLQINRSNLSEEQLKKIETAAQKTAIGFTQIQVTMEHPEIESAQIWKAIYEAHVHRKSGIDNEEVIRKVISADQSWKKSSGHAFEEIIKKHATLALNDTGIEIILQKDLNKLIGDGKLNNHERDIVWLKQQIEGSIFDLYATITTENGEKHCFGCVQSKTSIRDRTTRDREPSIHAMDKFFWSVVFTLDGDYLRHPKFIAMVNGGHGEFIENGWHGMYVLSDREFEDRIYSTDIHFKIFREHAIQAANEWIHRRQWFNKTWKASF